MKYVDGKRVLLRDKVNLGGGVTGIVVALIDDGKYSSQYPIDEWSYLSVGALVESSEGELIHFSDSKGDFVLLERHGADSSGGMRR